MKKIIIPIIALLLFAGFSCGSKNAEAQNSDSVATMIDAPTSGNPPLLIGKWRVDSSGFIDNNVRKPLDVPLANTIWEFTPDDKVSITGAFSITLDCKVVDNSFALKMMSTESTYRITKLTSTELELMSTLTDTKDLKMESIIKFSKMK